MDSVVAWVDWSKGPVHAAPGRVAPRYCLSTRDVLIVGDVRLDGALELATQLDAPGASGLELVARAYLKWGVDATTHLFGDFAFIVVDRRAATVFAARDPSGVRPLVYRRVGATLTFARDPAPLARATSPTAALDDDEVRSFLTGVGPSTSRTMFRGVLRLPPGHALRATASSTTVRRYWYPPPRALAGEREEHRAELRRLLEDAVDARLGSRALVHVSGGLDSSSVAALASRIASRVASGRDVRLVHAHCEGADERTWVRDLERHLGRAIEIVVATPTEEIDDALDHSHPFRYPLAAIGHGIQRIVERDGIRAVMTGLGGDEVFFERGSFRDLASNLRIFRLLDETMRPRIYSSRSGRFFLRDAFTALLPAAIRRARARLRSKPHLPWLRGSPPAVVEAPEPTTWTSQTQRVTWEWLTSPALAAGIESEERGLRALGVEIACPLLDRRIAERVLALPFESRLPRGRMKALLRDAMGDALPESVRERRTVTAYDVPIAKALAEKAPALRRVLHEGPWRAEPFVDRLEARRLLASLTTTDLSSALTLWDIVSLELWLRECA